MRFMNYSRQRELILDTLKDNVVHPSADYLYAIIKNELPNISLATVYRNLNKLAESGTIKKIEGLENSVHFDHNTHEHYHFICLNCKKIFDVTSDIAPDLNDKVSEKSGHKVVYHEITFRGICNECIRKGEE